MKHLLLLMVLLPSIAMTQGIYASLDGSVSELDVNGTVTIGYRLKGFHAGAGVGMSRVTFQNSVIKSYGIYHPAFLELAYHSPKRELAPYFAIRGGLLLNARNGVLSSPINIDGSYMGTARAGLAFKRKEFYIVPFVQYNTRHFDRNHSRNVGVACQINGFGGGVNLVF